MKQKHHKNVQVMFSWYFGCIINTKFLFCKGEYIFYIIIIVENLYKKELL
jgi:hypothetical protein